MREKETNYEVSEKKMGQKNDSTDKNEGRVVKLELVWPSNCLWQ